ncbi:hypothetical protein [Streptomyces axinellae]|uniref:Uncharacterized protein n=1 Tax=Streptomyces axinellae TaxID=552788 RepID=A0ABN3QYT2_9ACTN
MNDRGCTDLPPVLADTHPGIERLGGDIDEERRIPFEAGEEEDEEP